MNTKTKNLIRAAVLVALFAWPAFETYRYYAVTQDLLQSEQRLATVDQRLAQVRMQQNNPAVMKASLKANK